MAFKNFKLETDADGIVLVTWDTPGRSMNVLDETSATELEEIVKQTTADAAVKGVVITSGKEALCAGADLSMLEGMAHQYADLLKAKGEEAANQMLFDQSRRFSQVYRNIEISGKPWVAAINGLALGGGFELTLACHYRVAADNPEDPARPARSEGRPVPRRRRHPARAAHRAARRCDAAAAEGRGDQPHPRQGAQPHSRHRPARRHDQGGEGLDQGRRQGRSRPGTRRASSFPAARCSPRRACRCSRRATRSTAARPTTIIRRRAPS